MLKAIAARAESSHRERISQAINDESISTAVVSTEFWTPCGRPDIAVQSGKLLAFIEAKVDSSELVEDGLGQTQRYQKVLDEESSDRTKVLYSMRKTFSSGVRPPKAFDTCRQNRHEDYPALVLIHRKAELFH